MFSNNKAYQFLTKNYKIRFVDVVHTDMDVLGQNFTIGYMVKKFKS
jgi:hypothetical protein